MQLYYQLLADSILILHVLIVLFNVGALPLIWLGHFRKWAFVRSFSFRMVHLLMIGFIAAESLLSVICPLTIWEDALRLKAGTGSRYRDGFIAHWLHQFLFYDLDERVFATGYVLFFALVLLTLILVKPRAPRWRPLLSKPS